MRATVAKSAASLTSWFSRLPSSGQPAQRTASCSWVRAHAAGSLLTTSSGCSGSSCWRRQLVCCSWQLLGYSWPSLPHTGDKSAESQSLGHSETQQR